MVEKNDDGGGLLVIALISLGFGFVLLAMVVIGILAFIAFVMTILAFCAWKKPLRIGKIVVEPHDAHSFVLHGLMGAAALPAFFLFVDLLFDFRVNWHYLLHFLLLGYTGGALGLTFLLTHDVPQTEVIEPRPPGIQMMPTPQVTPMAAPPPAEPPAEPQPITFRFAVWDDEEELWP